MTDTQMMENQERGTGNRGRLEAKCFGIADASVWRSVMTTVFDCYMKILYCAGIIISRQVLIV